MFFCLVFLEQKKKTFKLIPHLLSNMSEEGKLNKLNI